MEVDNSNLVLELDLSDSKIQFISSIEEAQIIAEKELKDIEELIIENEDVIKKLTSECDKTDYILAVCSGTLCGMFDIFLVDKPNQNQLQNATDKWFENRTKDFAKLFGWKKDDDTIESAISYLEDKFKVPYDQTSMGESGKIRFDLNTRNHHFKSLGHNPTLLGLFFSILNQFTNTSSFVSEGQFITHSPNNIFELEGKDFPSKLFCGFTNWFGHLISDMSGSSNSKGRGMGIPAPFLSWTNDIIVIKRNLNMPAFKFEQYLNELAEEIYTKGYDLRFQTVQMIPVLVNELIVRFLYTIRRLVQYLMSNSIDEYSFKNIWKYCDPFSSSTVKRMLTVAHGSFCLIDISDAIIQGVKNHNIAELVMKLNVPEIGRFSLSLYGEQKRAANKNETGDEIKFLKKKESFVKDYLKGLKELAEMYNDIDLINFAKDFESSDLYLEAFEKSVQLAKKRSVDEERILKDKTDIDDYFNNGGL